MACLYCQRLIKDHNEVKSKECLTWALQQVDDISANYRKFYKKIEDRIEWLNKFGRNVFDDKYIKEITLELKTILKEN